TPDEKPLLLRLFNAVSNPLDRTQSSSVPDCSDYEIKLGNVDRVDADFRFLQSNHVAPVAIRLALELAEAARAIRRDPLAFIAARSDRNAISIEKRERMRTGVAVAVFFYTLVLGEIYASYTIYHRITAIAARVKHLEITCLAPPPMPVKKVAPQLTEAAGTTGDQLAAPAKPAARPKIEP